MATPYEPTRPLTPEEEAALAAAVGATTTAPAPAPAAQPATSFGLTPAPAPVQGAVPLPAAEPAPVYGYDPNAVGEGYSGDPGAQQYAAGPAPAPVSAQGAVQTTVPVNYQAAAPPPAPAVGLGYTPEGASAVPGTGGSIGLGSSNAPGQQPSLATSSPAQDAASRSRQAILNPRYQVRDNPPGPVTIPDERMEAAQRIGGVVNRLLPALSIPTTAINAAKGAWEATEGLRGEGGAMAGELLYGRPDDGRRRIYHSSGQARGAPAQPDYNALSPATLPGPQPDGFQSTLAGFNQAGTNLTDTIGGFVQGVGERKDALGNALVGAAGTANQTGAGGFNPGGLLTGAYDTANTNTPRWDIADVLDPFVNLAGSVNRSAPPALGQWGSRLAEVTPRPNPEVAADIQRQSDRRALQQTPGAAEYTPTMDAAVNAIQTGGRSAIETDPAANRRGAQQGGDRLAGFGSRIADYFPEPAETIETRGDLNEQAGRYAPQTWGGGIRAVPDPSSAPTSGPPALPAYDLTTGPITGPLNTASDALWGKDKTILDALGVGGPTGDWVNPEIARTFNSVVDAAASGMTPLVNEAGRRVTEVVANPGEFVPGGAGDTKPRPGTPAGPGFIAPGGQRVGSTGGYDQLHSDDLAPALARNKDAWEAENGILYLKGVTDADGNKVPVGYDTGKGIEIRGSEVSLPEFWAEAEAAGRTPPSGAGGAGGTGTVTQTPTPVQGSATPQPVQSIQSPNTNAPTSSPRQTNTGSQSRSAPQTDSSSSRQRGSSVGEMFDEDDDFGLNERDFTEKDYDGDGRISAKDRSVGRKRYQTELSKRRKKGKRGTSFGNVPQREDSPIRTKVLSAIDQSVNKKKKRR